MARRRWWKAEQVQAIGGTSRPADGQDRQMVARRSCQDGRRRRPARIRPKSQLAMAVTAVVGGHSASGRVPVGRAGNGGHDGGDDNGDRVSGRLELAPHGNGRKTIKTTLAAMPATSAAGTGDDRPVVTWRLRRWSKR